MSYKIEIIDEYSHGEWFSHSLRFTTEAEAVDCSRHFEGAGWHGIIDLRVVPSDDPVNARRTEKGTTDQDGKPFYTPPPTPSPRNIGPKRTDWEPHGTQSSHVCTNPDRREASINAQQFVLG